MTSSLFRYFEEPEPIKVSDRSPSRFEQKNVPSNELIQKVIKSPEIMTFNTTLYMFGHNALMRILIDIIQNQGSLCVSVLWHLLVLDVAGNPAETRGKNKLPPAQYTL